MNQSKLRMGCIAGLLIYMVLAIVFPFICGDQLRYRDRQVEMITPAGVIGEITSDTVVRQKISLEDDLLTGITLMGATYERKNTGRLVVELYSGETMVERREVDISQLSDNTAFFIPFSAKIPNGGTFFLQITAPESSPGNAMTLYYGNTMQAGHIQISAGLDSSELVQVSGQTLDGALSARLNTRKILWFGDYYWHIAVAMFLLLAGYCASLLWKNRRGRNSPVLYAIRVFVRYRYLIKQLVVRDFKTKYKRSVLGVLWSFLNPLLIMTVQYVVFSRLFRSDIPNFALYLLIGIVCFGFFNEATNLALTSILGNASLISKVYVPKFIYPLTRIISSSINFLLALLPLSLVMLLTRTAVHRSILLLPIGIGCLFALSLGVGLILAASMVFFRDTQFLWGVVSMLWMYATPIIYPEHILPERLLPLFKCNPLYHIIRFFRIVLMDGISPEPKAYILMLVASLISFVLGLWVFRKTQDRFVLYI